MPRKGASAAAKRKKKKKKKQQHRSGGGGSKGLATRPDAVASRGGSSTSSSSSSSSLLLSLAGSGGGASAAAVDGAVDGASCTLLEAEFRDIVRHTAFAPHLLQPASVDDREGQTAPASAARMRALRRGTVAEVLTELKKMLNRLGNALPRSGIDLSLRIADIDACLNECFQDFRLYTILRSFTRFLAGELRLPRLSRLITVECDRDPDDEGDEEELLALCSAGLFSVEDEDSSGACIRIPLPRRRYKQVTERTDSVMSLLDSLVDLAFAPDNGRSSKLTAGIFSSAAFGASGTATREMDQLKTLVHSVITQQMRIRKELEHTSDTLLSLQGSPLLGGDPKPDGKASGTDSDSKTGNSDVSARIGRHPALAGNVLMTARRLEVWESDVARLVECVTDAALVCHQLSDASEKVLGKFIGLQMAFHEARGKLDDVYKRRRLKECQLRIMLRDTGVDPVMEQHQQHRQSPGDQSGERLQDYCEGETRQLYHETNKAAFGILQQQANELMRLFPELQTFIFRSASSRASRDEFVAFHKRAATRSKMTSRSASFNLPAARTSKRRTARGGIKATLHEEDQQLFQQIEEDWHRCSALSAVCDKELASAVAAVLQRANFAGSGRVSSICAATTTSDSGNSDQLHIARFVPVQRCLESWRSHIDGVKEKVRRWTEGRAAEYLAGDNSESSCVGQLAAPNAPPKQDVGSSGAATANEAAVQSPLLRDWAAFDQHWSALIAEEEYAMRREARLDDHGLTQRAAQLKKLKQRQRQLPSADDQRKSTARLVQVQESQLSIHRGFFHIRQNRRRVNLAVRLQTQLKTFYFSVQCRLRAVCDDTETSDATLAQTCALMLLSKLSRDWRDAQAELLLQELEQTAENDAKDKREKKEAAVKAARLKKQQRLEREQERKHQKKVMLQREENERIATEAAASAKAAQAMRAVPASSVQKEEHDGLDAPSARGPAQGQEVSPPGARFTLVENEPGTVVASSKAEIEDMKVQTQGNLEAKEDPKRVPPPASVRVTGNGANSAAVSTTRSIQKGVGESIYNLSPRFATGSGLADAVADAEVALATDDVSRPDTPDQPCAVKRGENAALGRGHQGGARDKNTAGGANVTLAGIPAPVTAIHAIQDEAEHRQNTQQPQPHPYADSSVGQQLPVHEEPNGHLKQSQHIPFGASLQSRGSPPIPSNHGVVFATSNEWQAHFELQHRASLNNDLPGHAMTIQSFGPQQYHAQQMAYHQHYHQPAAHAFLPPNLHAQAHSVSAHASESNQITMMGFMPLHTVPMQGHYPQVSSYPGSHGARPWPVAQSRETHMASFVIVLAQSLYHFDLVRRRCLSSKLLDKVLREQRQNPNFQQREQQEHRTMDATESLLSAFMEAFVHERSTIPASTPSPSTNGVAVSGAPRGSGIVANFAIRRRLASAFLLAAPNSASTAGACRDFVAALYRGWQLKASRLSRAASSGPAEHDAVGKLLTNEINRTFFCPFLSAATRIKTKEGHAGSVAAPWPLQRQFMLEVSARSLARHLEDPSRWGSVGVESTEKQPKDWSSANAAKQSRVWSAVICSLHRTENKASVQAAASGWREGVHWDRAQFAEYKRRVAHEGRSKGGHVFCVGLNWPSQDVNQRQALETLLPALLAAETLRAPTPPQGEDASATASCLAPACKLQCVVSQVGGNIVSFCRSSILKVWIRVNAGTKVELVGPSWSDVHRNMCRLQASPLLLFYHING